MSGSPKYQKEFRRRWQSEIGKPKCGPRLAKQTYHALAVQAWEASFYLRAGPSRRDNKGDRHIRPGKLKKEKTVSESSRRDDIGAAIGLRALVTQLIPWVWFHGSWEIWIGATQVDNLDVCETLSGWQGDFLFFFFLFPTFRYQHGSQKSKSLTPSDPEPAWIQCVSSRDPLGLGGLDSRKAALRCAYLSSVVDRPEPLLRTRGR